uniref:Pentraxin 4 n=1 Tax=Varanus komodoensis TaxID=61221 RepID=A0A8D2JC95_VARKO
PRAKFGSGAQRPLTLCPAKVYDYSSHHVQPAGPRSQPNPACLSAFSQFRRFQEVTLLRFHEIAGNHNVSQDADAQLERLRGRQEALESAANETHAATRQELGRLRAQLKKLRRKTGEQEARLTALQEAWQESTAGAQRQEALLADLARDVASQREAGRAVRAAQQSLQKALEGVQDALKSQGSNRLMALSQDHGEQSAVPTARALPLPELEADAASLLDPQALRQPASVQGRVPEGPLQGLRQPGAGSSRASSGGIPPPPPRATVPCVTRLLMASLFLFPLPVCNVGSMLVFPNASTENFAVIQPGPRTSLLELSVCSWVRTPAGYLGTILSYATEENDNKLVLHGRDVAPRSAVHFVIGDPAFRELPVGRVLDGTWHHLCTIWSSIQGRYWFFVDRRLVSMGSRFRRGYEIPPGGSLILGQEQDVLGGGFEPSEAFVGFLAGFAMWDRALSPGEVSGLAVGSGLPRGPLLTLADVSALHGSVRKVNCTCLELCL